MSKNFLTDWTIKNLKDGTSFSGKVPGDIHNDLFNAGLIKEPYYGLNHKEMLWVSETDFEYSTVFNATKELFLSEEILLVFEGVDLFSDIFVNGKKVGSTEDMFLSYSFNVKDLLKEGDNDIKVVMHSTRKAMDKINDEGYFGVFNIKRLFIRKAQCHFGWDWAPDICGYGIYKNCYISGEYATRIANVNYVTDKNGFINFNVELNYNVRAMVDFHGEVIKGSSVPFKDDKLVIEVVAPDGKTYKESATVKEKKNLINVKIDNPELWWPIGYGKQPLYKYTVNLYRDGKLVYVSSGKAAFRTCELEEIATGKDSLSYTYVINGKPIFAKGSNWVPLDSFTGTITHEKYDKFIKYALDANVNLLRVWGGGIFEDDYFYDKCDELGIMVSQDFMFACGDIPEDDEHWLKLVLKECEYQIKRLRVHPSIVAWCGGNEKTGSYGLQISKGDFFADYIMQGLVYKFDRSRPFSRQSPCSHTDVGNDMTSGDSHAGSFEVALNNDVCDYRKTVASSVVPFISECAIMGPQSVESNKKIYPEDKLWPFNEYWEDRLMDNPYAAVIMPFVERERLYAKKFYGEPKNLTDFTAKGMLVHAEVLRAESEHARVNKFKCSGFANWMFTDIWPCGTWAVVDYFGEPKSAYYAMRRSYAPVLLTFSYDETGRDSLYIVNDSFNKLKGKVVYGFKTFDGREISKKVKVTVEENGVTKIDNDIAFTANGYYFARAVLNGKEYKTTYSNSMWTDAEFKGSYTYKVDKIKDNKIAVKFKSKGFNKSVYVTLNNNCDYLFGDNYFDMEDGEEKTIFITSDKKIDVGSLKVSDFAKDVL